MEDKLLKLKEEITKITSHQPLYITQFRDLSVQIIDEILANKEVLGLTYTVEESENFVHFSVTVQDYSGSHTILTANINKEDTELINIEKQQY